MEYDSAALPGVSSAMQDSALADEDIEEALVVMNQKWYYLKRFYQYSDRSDRGQTLKCEREGSGGASGPLGEKDEKMGCVHIFVIPLAASVIYLSDTAKRHYHDWIRHSDLIIKAGLSTRMTLSQIERMIDKSHSQEYEKNSNENGLSSPLDYLRLIRLLEARAADAFNIIRYNLRFIDDNKARFATWKFCTDASYIFARALNKLLSFSASQAENDGFLVEGVAVDFLGKREAHLRIRFNYRGRARLIIDPTYAQFDRAYINKIRIDRADMPGPLSVIPLKDYYAELYGEYEINKALDEIMSKLEDYSHIHNSGGFLTDLQLKVLFLAKCQLLARGEIDKISPDYERNIWNRCSDETYELLLSASTASEAGSPIYNNDTDGLGNHCFGRGSWGESRENGRYYNAEAVEAAFFPVIKQLKRYFQTFIGVRLLEIGCGTGNLLQYLKTKGMRARGIDNDPETVKIARKKVKEVVCVERIPEIKSAFPGERFNVVISSFLLQKPTLTPAEILQVIKYANISLTDGGIHIHAAAHTMPLQYFKSQGIAIITSISANPGIYPYYHLIVGEKNSKRSDSPMEQGDDSAFAGSPLEGFLALLPSAETNTTKTSFGAAVNTMTSNIPSSPARVEKGLPYTKPDYNTLWDIGALGQRLKLNTPLVSFLLLFESASLKPAEVASLVTNKGPPRLILKAFSLAFNDQSLFLSVLIIPPDFIPAAHWAVFGRMKPLIVLSVYYCLFSRTQIQHKEEGNEETSHPSSSPLGESYSQPFFYTATLNSWIIRYAVETRR